MKKLLVLLIVALALFGFSAGAFAQLLDVCAPCKGCNPVAIACGSSQQSCAPITLCNREIFSICNCLNAGTTFVSGHRIGIRMTILVDGVPGQNGAYWADPTSAEIHFSMYATQAAACDGTAFTKTFGPGSFFKTAANGTAITTLPLPVPRNDSGTCTVLPANQATMIVTDPAYGYVITDADELNKLSRWWMEIPRIRIDSGVLANGAKISIKIETLDQSTGGICADCVATCECTVLVAVYCAPDTTTYNTCMFPYFTSTNAASAGNPFWNGIALVNTSSIAGTVKMTVYQQDGKTGTFTTPSIPAHSMFVSTLDNISFTGTGLGGQRLYITAVSSFGALEGFGMIANTATGESMGYLCRQSSTK
jgi:hypothetical protein